MLKDCNHDLIHSLSEKSDAVWRYEREYLKNAEKEGCDKCVELWKKILEDDNKHLEMIQKEIERHIEEKKFE